MLCFAKNENILKEIIPHLHILQDGVQNVNWPIFLVIERLFKMLISNVNSLVDDFVFYLLSYILQRGFLPSALTD